MSEAQAWVPGERRPIASRRLRLFQWMSTRLAQAGVSANGISLASVAFAAAAGAVLLLTADTEGLARRGCWLAAAILIQLRLIANMLDGMVALASGKASPIGELFNEVPDRIADPLILIGAGYAAGGHPTLGFAAALVALFVAYVRAIGASCGAGQHFIGPMAKPHRMFVLTLICLYAALTPIAWQRLPLGSAANATGFGVGLMTVGLWIIVIGGLLTAARRLARIAAAITQRRA